MNRAERRRQEKAAGKVKPKSIVPAPVYLPGQTIEQIAKITGARVESLQAYLDARDAEFREAAAEVARDEIWEAESYAGAMNVLISLYAIKMTWGFTKANQRFLDNMNPAKEYVERIGFKAAYEQAHREMGIEIEFDDPELNRKYGLGGESDNQQDSLGGTDRAAASKAAEVEDVKETETTPGV